MHRHYNINIFALSTCVLSILVMQSVNGAQLLDIVCLIFLAMVLTSVAPAPKTVMFPLKHITTVIP